MAIPPRVHFFEASDERPADGGTSQCWRAPQRDLWRLTCVQGAVEVVHSRGLREQVTGTNSESLQETPDAPEYRHTTGRNSAGGHSEDEPVVQRHEVQHDRDDDGETCEPSCDQLGQMLNASYTGPCNNNDHDQDAVGSWPPATGGAFVSGRGAECPLTSQSFSKSSDITSFSPQQCQDIPQGHRDTAEPSSPEIDVVVSGPRIRDEYKSMPFVARQELEQLAAKRRREEWVMAEDRARRTLSSRGCWMNPTSRAILARYSRGGGGGASSPSPYDRRREGAGQSVFERLARRGSQHDAKGYFEREPEYQNSRRTSTVGFDGCGDGTLDRQPFQPIINLRSAKLASRMPHRDEDSHLSLQQRLHEDGEERLWKQEKRVELATQAFRDNTVGSFVSVGSERVLAKRSKTKMVRFRSKIIELAKVS